MGGISTKEEIIARLDDLDKEEIMINKELRELQLELNGIVPVKDRVKVKKEYFDNISMGEKDKHQENPDSNNDIDELEDENLEDLEEEDDEEDDDDDEPKKKKKKKVKYEKKEKKSKKSKKNKK